MTTPRPDVLTPREVAAELGVHLDTVRRWIRDGRLPAARLGYRTIRIRREDLAGFLRTSAEPPRTASPA